MQARKDMDPKFQWDFTHMYASDEAWEAELNAIEQDLPKIAAIEGTLGNSRESFKAGIDTVNGIAQRLEKAYIYANLHRCADGSETKHQEMDGKATNVYVQFSTMLAFFEPEILAIPEEKLSEFLAPDEMKPYRFTIENITRTRAHCLPAQRERMLAMMGDAALGAQDG